jgi:cell division protease FtsH
MILEWGMSDKLGFINYAGNDNREVFIPEKEYSDDTARIIDEEIKRLIDEAYRESERMIGENWDKVIAVAEALLKYETLTGDDINRIMQGQVLDKPTVSELLQKEAARGEEPKAAPATGGNELGDEPAGGVLPSPA